MHCHALLPLHLLQGVTWLQEEWTLLWDETEHVLTEHRFVTRLNGSAAG